MNKRILRLALPNIITNISLPLLNLVDMGLLGHLGSELYLGAVALGGVVFNFIFWGFSFLRMSASGFTAQAVGRRDQTESALVLARGLLVGLGSGLLLILLQWPIGQLAFYLLDGSPEVKQLAWAYFEIRIYSAPAAIGTSVFLGWFLGMQNARIPMVLSMFTNLLNIGLNLWLILGLGWKVEGVAIGNVCAQYVGFGLAVAFFLGYYGHYRHHWSWRGLFQTGPMKQFFSVNRDIFIRTLCLILVFTWFTSSSAGLNNTVLAANSLLLQFLLFFSFFTDGFAYAAEALAGKFTGRGQAGHLRTLVKWLMGWGLGLSILFMLLYQFGGSQIVRLLTDQEQVALYAEQYLPWLAVLPLVSFASYLFDGLFIGLTASVAMRNSMLIASLLTFFPLYFLLHPTFGNHALWLAMTGFMAARGIAQAWLWYWKLMPAVAGKTP